MATDKPNSPPPALINKLDLLVALYVFAIIMGETLGIKTFNIGNIGSFNVHASVALFTLPVIYAIDNIIGEVHGRARARQLVVVSVIIVALLGLAETLAILLPPSARFEPMVTSYNSVFQASIRFSIASMSAYAIGGLLDVAIFSRLRQKLHHRALWLRNGLSSVGSQLADTLVFMTIAFYAFEESLGANISFILSLVIPYLILRYIVSFALTPVVYGGIKWLKAGQPEPAKATARAS